MTVISNSLQHRPMITVGFCVTWLWRLGRGRWENYCRVKWEEGGEVSIIVISITHDESWVFSSG